MTHSPRCEAAINYAKKAYTQLGHPYLSSAHLVLGLLALSGGVGDSLLKKSGLSLEYTERFLSSRRVAGEEAVEQDGASFGRSATDALSRAELEAGRFNHTILGVEHLTLALLAEDHGEAYNLFLSVPVEREKLRSIILLEMN
jgi:ATP-dependent Clp protease ATP-binding subunit ClpA